MINRILEAVIRLITAFFEIMIKRHDAARKENTIEKTPANDNRDLRDRLLARVRKRGPGDDVQP